MELKMDDPGGAIATSLMSIDLGAVAKNYQILRSKIGAAECAAAVKADAYGLGAAEVAPVLAAEGCSIFFVATLEEGIALRGILPSRDMEIAVLNGVLAGAEEVFVEHGLIPVINDPAEIDRWRAFVMRSEAPLDAMLHVDTGMNRLGLSPRDLDHVAGVPEVLEGPNWRFVISHLASSDDPDNPSNDAQLARFQDALARLPRMPASLAASGGVFLGPRFHFDLARPGISLYGGNPCPSTPNPMHPAVTILGRILQVRDVEPGMTVGYGGRHTVKSKGRIATVAAGYADGYLRSGSDEAHVYLGQTRLPVIGRISMDLITVDVTDALATEAIPGNFVELLGERVTADDAANFSGTISDEIFTSLGRRYHRRYVSPPATH